MTIKLYTTSTCSFCPMVKKYLGMKGLDYTEINVEDPRIALEVQKKYGAMTVPVTVIDEVAVIGYNLGQLAQALAKATPALA